MTTIRTPDDIDTVRAALRRALTGRSHFNDRPVLQRLIADLDSQAALIERGGVVADPIRAAVDARLEYDRDPQNGALSGVFIAAESRLSDEQFHTYMDQYRQASRSRG